MGDDEIIEDALFSKRFVAMNPTLLVDLCPREIEVGPKSTKNVIFLCTNFFKLLNLQPAQERTIEMEMKTIQKILSDINKILVHGSPVIVIQRWIRGHLCRRKRNISYFEIK